MPSSSVTSLGVAPLMWRRGVPNGYSAVSSYQVPSISKYYPTPMSFLVGIGIALLMWRRGVPNGFSAASSYQVPSSSKYYPTPTSFVAGIGVTWLIRRRGVPNGYSMPSSYKCQLVQNIIRCQQVFWSALALLAVYGIVECNADSTASY